MIDNRALVIAHISDTGYKRWICIIHPLNVFATQGGEKQSLGLMHDLCLNNEK